MGELRKTTYDMFHKLFLGYFHKRSTVAYENDSLYENNLTLFNIYFVVEITYTQTHIISVCVIST